MPYKSEAQRAFFHTATARKKGISAATVKEFDDASKGMKLPKKMPMKKMSHDQKFVKAMKQRGGM